MLASLPVAPRGEETDSAIRSVDCGMTDEGEETLARQEFRDAGWLELERSFRERNPGRVKQAAEDIAEIGGTYERHRDHWAEFQDAMGITRPRRGPAAASRFQPVCRHLLGLGIGGDHTGQASVWAVVLDAWVKTGIAASQIPAWIAESKGGIRGIYAAADHKASAAKFYELIDEDETTCEWYTPEYIFQKLECQFDLDPASPGQDIVPWVPALEHFTEGGLDREWEGFVWLNAPFGKDLSLWLEKFCKHGNGITIVRDAISTRWWQKLAPCADLMLCVNKKIAFVNSERDNKQAAAIGHMLVGIGEQAVAALTTAARNGLGLLVKPDGKGTDLSTRCLAPDFNNQTIADDVVYRPARNGKVCTGDVLARRIVNYLPIGPTDFCVDPCRGPGAFYKALPEGRRDWCEIRDGRNFLTYEVDRPIDWVITNPAWSGDYREIAHRAFRLANHVVFLVKLDVALNTYARQKAWREAGHGLREVHIIPWADAEFVNEDGTDKLPEGFPLAVIWWTRGWPDLFENGLDRARADIAEAAD